MNIEKLKKYQWGTAVIQFEKERGDDYLFSYDVDKISEPFVGRLRIEKSIFDEVLKNGVHSEFALEAVESNRIVFVRSCSKPLQIIDSLPEFDYWSVLLAQRYLEEFTKTKRMPIRTWIPNEKIQDGIN